VICPRFPQSAIKKHELSPKLWLSHPGISHEPDHRYSSESYLGNGLSNAFKGALAQNSELQIDTIFSTLNGESFGSKELSVAMTRNNQRFSEDVKILHPADCFGEYRCGIWTCTYRVNE
jgi:3-oxoacyl-[acyl-carrier-protein] synthase I